jgi:hypothetical protein
MLNEPGPLMKTVHRKDTYTITQVQLDLLKTVLEDIERSKISKYEPLEAFLPQYKDPDEQVISSD